MQVLKSLQKKMKTRVQSKKNIDLNDGLGQAVREYQTDVGAVDYALFVDKKAVGVIGAKRAEEGHNITNVEQQSEGYAAAQLKWVNNKEPLPFIYESTGVLTRFTDQRDPRPRSREVFSFHRPETIKVYRLLKHALGKRVAEVDALLKLLLPLDTRQAEIAATLYAAWNNLLLLGASPSDEDIVYETRENWHTSKLKIEREKFSRDWNGCVIRGWYLLAKGVMWM